MVKGGNSEITHKEYCTFVMMKHTIMSNIYYGGGEMANSSNAGSQHMILHKNKKRKKKKNIQKITLMQTVIAKRFYELLFKINENSFKLSNSSTFTFAFCPYSNGSQLVKGRICSSRSKFFPLRVDFHIEGPHFQTGVHESCPICKINRIKN